GTRCNARRAPTVFRLVDSEDPVEYTRRDIAKMALAVPGVALFGRSGSLLAAGLQAAKPNSLINGVQIGTITYSYRSMADQSAEATLKYVVDSGISAIELM